MIFSNHPGICFLCTPVFFLLFVSHSFLIWSILQEPPPHPPSHTNGSWEISVESLPVWQGLYVFILHFDWTCSSRFKLIFPLELWRVSLFSSSVQFCSNPGKKDGDSDQGRSNGGYEKWLHSRYTLEVGARRICQRTVRERSKA